MLGAEFTPKVHPVVGYANEEAIRSNHGQIDSGHLFLGLLKRDPGIAVRVFQELGVDLEKLDMEARMIIKKISIYTANARRPPQDLETYRTGC